MTDQDISDVRLADVVSLELGQVLKDKNGVDFVFCGFSKPNSAGNINAWFMPSAALYPVPHPASFVFWVSGVKKFPSLVNHLRPDKIKFAGHRC